MAIKTNTQTVRIDWFDKPVQVQFYDYDNDVWIGGIGYRNEIICCECGGVVALDELYDAENLVLEPNPVRLLGEWVDISEYMF